MRKFGINILIFSIPALLLVIATSIFYNFNKLKVDLKIKEISEYECLLMGDSQIQRLNGDLLSYKTKNIASSAEHFYFTYNKLLKFIEKKDHKVDKVILGVSIHNFAPVYNRAFDLNFPEGKSSLRKYLYFFPFFNNHDFINFRHLSISKLITGIYSGPVWGGFFESNYLNPNTETINKTFKMHFSIKKNEERYSYSQRRYLYKIDSLCTINKIDLILVSTPYHSIYKDQIQKGYYDFFYETIRNLKNNYHINFLSEAPQSNLMSDANHLNKAGSQIYSKKINDNINARTQDNVRHTN